MFLILNSNFNPIINTTRTEPIAGYGDLYGMFLHEINNTHCGNLALLLPKSLDSKCCCFQGEVYLHIITNLTSQIIREVSQEGKKHFYQVIIRSLRIRQRKKIVESLKHIFFMGGHKKSQNRIWAHSLQNLKIILEVRCPL